jgi:hypothetical protein
MLGVACSRGLDGFVTKARCKDLVSEVRGFSGLGSAGPASPLSGAQMYTTETFIGTDSPEPPYLGMVYR